MNMALPKRGLARHAAALITSAAAVALVTASIYALDSFAPVLSLGVLYVFAVLPVAVLFGLAWAIPVSVASMLAFNWFFLPPKHTLRLSDGENWIALAVYLVTAVVVSALAMRSRAREEEAHERALEASLLAEVAGSAARKRERAERAARHLGPGRRGTRSRAGEDRAGLGAPSRERRVGARPESREQGRGQALPGVRARPRARAPALDFARLAPGSRDRPRATRPAGSRRRDPSAQRRDQDRDPARRQPRPALAR